MPDGALFACTALSSPERTEVTKAGALRTIYLLMKNAWKDAVTFGPAILLRGILPQDATGAISINTQFGEIHLRPSDSDMWILRAVFVWKQYDLNNFPQMHRILDVYRGILNAGKEPIIIDAGANIGASSIWFSLMFPDAKVIAVEPDPRNAAICRRNCKKLKNAVVEEAAIGSRPGRAITKRPIEDKLSWGIQTERREDGNVPLVTVDELVERSCNNGQLFLVKIDIEGFENDLFAYETGWLSEAEVIIIELHDWLLPNQYSSVRFQKAMLPLNFEVLISGENLIFVK
jgi:FkbM family methyltransferase